MVAALGAVGIGLALIGVPAVAGADESFRPPFIDHTEWVYRGDLSSLQVFPTLSGRAAAGTLKTTAEANEAWGEILADAPDADRPGMRAQFLCHWRLAEFGDPGKSSWNIEPWRPVVDDGQMFDSGCNPGGAEEPN